VNEAATLVQEASHEESNIIFGAVIDEALAEDEVRVTVIATGLEDDHRRERPRREVSFADLANVTPLRRDPEPLRETGPVAEALPGADPEAGVSKPPLPAADPAASSSSPPPGGWWRETGERGAPPEERFLSPFEDELDVPTFLRRRDDDEEDRETPAFLRRSAD
jgi:cell division protein FtsZ